MVQRRIKGILFIFFLALGEGCLSWGFEKDLDRVDRQTVEVQFWFLHWVLDAQLLPQFGIHIFLFSCSSGRVSLVGDGFSFSAFFFYMSVWGE